MPAAADTLRYIFRSRASKGGIIPEDMSLLDKLPFELPGQTLQYLTIGIPTAIALLLATNFTMGLFGKNQMPVAGRNIIITGGSQGMGLEAAKILAAQGANITIISRSMKKLEAARDEVQAVMNANSSKYPAQKLAIVSADLTNPESSKAAVLESESQIGETEILWCVAGSSTPKMFVDNDLSDFQAEMDANYFSTVYITHFVLKLMISRPPPNNTKGAPWRKIIFTSSIGAFCPVAGLAAYVPSKAALRALADSLRQECLLYDIDVQCCIPGTMTSPGFDHENITKHYLTKEIEKTDVFQTPKEAAEAIVKDVQKGETLPISNFQSRAARAAMTGPSPRAGFIVFEILLSWVACIVFIFVRREQDAIVLKDRKAKGLPWERKD